MVEGGSGFLEVAFYGFSGDVVQGAVRDWAADFPGGVGFSGGGEKGLAVGTFVLLHGVACCKAVVFRDFAVHVGVDVGA